MILLERVSRVSCSCVKFCDAVSNRGKKWQWRWEYFSTVSICPSRETKLFVSIERVSIYVASDYYLVNIDSQLASALMHRRILHLHRTCWRWCLSSSVLNRVISCKRCIVSSISWLFIALPLNIIRSWYIFADYEQNLLTRLIGGLRVIQLLKNWKKIIKLICYIF